MPRSEYNTDAMKREGFELSLGARLGAGLHRYVYECHLNEGLVLKIEPDAQSFANTIEWELWQRATGSEAEKWLAPCRAISPTGGVLAQDRTSPVPRDMLPRRMPVWMSDFKPENFGLLRGKLVCHDYGLPYLVDRPFRSKAMQTVTWR